MFGFSIGKLLILAAILLVVILGFKLVGRATALKRAADDGTADASRIDTVYDPETDSYVPRVKSKRRDKY